MPVPPDASDEMAGAINFGEEFTNRYGTGYPAFYPGSLEDAIKDSCLKPAKDVSLIPSFSDILILSIACIVFLTKFYHTLKFSEKTSCPLHS